MLPSWERVLYFNLLPAVLDGLVALTGVLVLLRIFRVRNPSLRALFLFIPLVRPLIIFLDGGARLKSQSPSQFAIGVRMPDPLNLLPIELGQEGSLSVVYQLIALLIIAAVALALIVLVIRWTGFLLFYRRLRHRCAPASEPYELKLKKLIEELSQTMGLKCPPEILFSHGKWATPCAIGWKRPALVIDPDLMKEFETQELRAIVAHELGHIQRGDSLWHWLSVLLRDVQFYNPFSHMSLARLGVEREKACDRIAIEAAHVSPRVLAESLVKILRLLMLRNSEPLPGYSMGFFRENNGLETRLKFLLSLPEDGDKMANGLHRKRIGKAKLAGLFAAWLPLTLIQFYICIWIGSFPLVIK